MTVVGVALGGALGTLARYLVSLTSRSVFSNGFPVGTLLVNVLGCYLIGFLAGLRRLDIVPPGWYLALGTGFLGGFTTFSAFALDSHTLVQDGAWSRATAYVLGNLVVGYLALLAGRATALRFGAGAG